MIGFERHHDSKRSLGIGFSRELENYSGLNITFYGGVVLGKYKDLAVATFAVDNKSDMRPTEPELLIRGIVHTSYEKLLKEYKEEGKWNGLFEKRDLDKLVAVEDYMSTSKSLSQVTQNPDNIWAVFSGLPKLSIFSNLRESISLDNKFSEIGPDLQNYILDLIKEKIKDAKL